MSVLLPEEQHNTSLNERGTTVSYFHPSLLSIRSLHKSNALTSIQRHAILTQPGGFTDLPGANICASLLSTESNGEESPMASHSPHPFLPPLLLLLLPIPLSAPLLLPLCETAASVTRGREAEEWEKEEKDSPPSFTFQRRESVIQFR